MSCYLFRKVSEQAVGHERSCDTEPAGTRRFHDVTDVMYLFPPTLELTRASGTRKSLRQTVRADTARETLAAGFMGEKFHGIVSDCNHITAVIEYNDAAGPEKRALAADTGFIKRHV